MDRLTASIAAGTRGARHEHLRVATGHAGLPWLAALLGLAGNACSASRQPASPDTPPSEARATLLFSAELQGNIEPCGCTSDPKGDLARTAAVLTTSRAAGHTLYMDGGSLLYTELSPSPERQRQEALKADMLRAALNDQLRPDAVGLGRHDLVAGVGAVAPARQAANVTAAGDAAAVIEAPKVVLAGELRIGVFGVVGREALGASSGLEVGDPEAAARQAIAGLRAAKADLVVGLLHMTSRDAKALARAVPGIDIALIGEGAPEPNLLRHEPDRVGDTWLVQPANRGQSLVKVEVTWRGGGPLADAIGSERAAHDRPELEARIAKAEEELHTLQAAPDADPDFLASRKADLDQLRTRLAELIKSPLQVPATGSYFTMSQVEIGKRLPCDAAIQNAKVEYDRAVGKANLDGAPAEPPAPAAGSAAYSGIGECGYCHEEAVAFWRKTRHASAWKTLVDGGKQYNLECVYCHAVGFGEPGGSTLATLARAEPDESLRDVQCEACHGPASLHVDADGKETPSSLVKSTPQERCVVCHNEKHSDTFQYEAYLRDVTGPGHGEERRKVLGDGPTGGELRSAALAKAGAAIGKGCPK